VSFFDRANTTYVRCDPRLAVPDLGFAEGAVQHPASTIPGRLRRVASRRERRAGHDPDRRRAVHQLRGTTAS